LKDRSTEEARRELIKLQGVGPKVSDCILLFSMEKYDAFPIDVWVKRVMEFFYFHKETTLKELQAFAAEKFGKIAGIAQQYLFYYARELGIGK
jgi:N-glycosylase/DNA lyase